jgi:hypothetical protein
MDRLAPASDADKDTPSRQTGQYQNHCGHDYLFVSDAANYVNGDILIGT